MNHKKSTKVIPDFDLLPRNSYIRQSELIKWHIIPFSASTLGREVKGGTFPSPIKISSNIIAFRVRDIREWQKDPANYYKSTTPFDFKPTTKNNHKASRGKQK
jgi:prophage regulatory protein